MHAVFEASDQGPFEGSYSGFDAPCGMLLLLQIKPHLKQFLWKREFYQKEKHTVKTGWCPFALDCGTTEVVMIYF